MTTRLSLLILSIIVLAGSQPVNPQRTASFNGFELVDKDGNITKKPANYRDHYEFLGTYTVLDPKGNQMHVTYASPGTAAYYRKTGKFPDGAVLVKEIFGTDHARLTTGDAHWPRDYKYGSCRSRTKSTAIQITRCGAMDGGGSFSKPTHQTSKWRLITRRTAWAVTSPLSPPTGRT